MRFANRLTPVRATFFASLTLSLIAWFGSTVNRDGMLYVKAAHAFLDGGFAAAREVFNWPFLPVAMGIVSRISGLSPETSGYLLNALFMAGACALMVACIERRQRELAWAACLTVLALPGLNEYRNELLREYGCWFFVMLSFWLAQRWSERPHWLGALAVQAILGIAALFRPEAAALFAALVAWQWFEAPREERWRRLMMLGTLPLVGAAALVAMYLGGRFEEGSRLWLELNRISTKHFDTKAQALAAALIEYARDQARAILFFGSLALVPLKLIQKFGLLLLPFVLFLVNRELRAASKPYGLFAFGIVAHLLVLGVFVLDLQFLAGRYVGLILLFSTPFTAAGLLALIHRFPRWRLIVIVLAIALMAGNVVSTGLGKTHFVEAGRWLSEHNINREKSYIDSGRAAYYAGWHGAAIAVRNDRHSIEQAIATGNYEIFVLEVSRKDPPVDDWLQQIGLRVIQRFELPNRDAVLVAEPNRKQP
jgi:hypothetical protein